MSLGGTEGAGSINALLSVILPAASPNLAKLIPPSTRREGFGGGREGMKVAVSH